MGEHVRKEEEKMIVDSHVGGSKRGHNREKEYAKENGMKNMSDKELDWEIAELKERLSMMGMCWRS